MKTLQFRVVGLDCAQEAALLRSALAGKPGVADLSFDILHGQMTVKVDPALLSSKGIQDAVRSAGMQAEPWQDRRRAGESKWRTAWPAIVSGLALIAGMAVSAAGSENPAQILLAHDHTAHHAIPFAAVVLYAITIVAGAAPLVPKALASLRHLRPDMNALMFLSLIGAMILGEWTEAATLSFLFCFAGRLESWSLDRARDAIGNLLQVAPAAATVLHGGTAHGKEDHGEHEHRVPVEEVAPGTTVRVRPGEKVPFDGEVLRGISRVNQALVTGESAAVEKGPGDQLFAGSMNEDGVLDFTTASRSEDTTLARMFRMVEESQSRRAPSEQFVERFSRVYTPIVILLAFTVAVIPPLLGRGTWESWFYEGMVVLLISCPCALVISTPVTIVAALASAARQGILVKGGAFLEEAARVKAVAFDKTGVLTYGEPIVVEVRSMNGHAPDEVLAKAASLEVSSEHAVGRAIVKHAIASGVHVMPSDGFRAIQGVGAEATGGGGFWIGGARMIREHGVEDTRLAEELARLSGQGKTAVACGSGDKPWAVFTLADPVRAGAREAVSELRDLGIDDVVLLSGDNKVTVDTVGADVGVNEVHSELLPGEKALWIERLKAQFGHVVMVGDGVNDAQALAEATLGISMGHASSEVARETADIVLISSDLRQVPFLIRHARRARRVIYENVVFALVTKLLFLIAALLGVATLWMAVAADMGATLVVTLNGLRMLHPRGAVAASVMKPRESK